MKQNLWHDFKFIKKKLRSKKYTLVNMEKKNVMLFSAWLLLSCLGYLEY